MLSPGVGAFHRDREPVAVNREHADEIFPAACSLLPVAQDELRHGLGSAALRSALRCSRQPAVAHDFGVADA